MVIDSEARLQTRVRVGLISLCEPKVLVETGPWLESRFGVSIGLDSFFLISGSS